MSDDRENFAPNVKAIIAGRAGYRCSFPECDKPTISRGATASQTASVGVACHIYSASPKGPRGQGGLSAEQLTNAENGFWACQTHSKLVDTNDGRSFSAGLLLGWRELHEARIHREMGGIKLPVHWIEKLEIVTSPGRSQGGPLFAPKQCLNLARVTLLTGDNGSGKTALCEWLTGAANEEALTRWSSAELALSMTVYNPQRHVFSTEATSNGFVFRLDDDIVPFNPLPIAIQPVSHRARRPGQTHVEWMAEALGVTSAVVRRLIRSIEATGPSFLDGIRLGDEDAIGVRLPEHEHWDTLGSAGGSGQLLTAIELGARSASNRALHVPSLMVIEGLWAFDPSNKAMVLGKLGNLSGVQSLATLPEVDGRLIWGGWNVATIREGETGGTITDG